jgi:hypothetical protein
MNEFEAVPQERPVGETEAPEARPSVPWGIPVVTTEGFRNALVSRR